MIPAARRRLDGHAGQRGTIALEAVVIFPLVLLIAWIGMQLVLLHLANRVALAAAQEGARGTRVRGGTVSAGEHRANRYLAQFDGTLLIDPTIDAARSSGTATVQVDGRAPRLVPLLPLQVRQVAQSPVEQFDGSLP